MTRSNPRAPAKRLKQLAYEYLVYRSVDSAPGSHGFVRSRDWQDGVSNMVARKRQTERTPALGQLSAETSADYRPPAIYAHHSLLHL